MDNLARAMLREVRSALKDVDKTLVAIERDSLPALPGPIPRDDRDTVEYLQRKLAEAVRVVDQVAELVTPESEGAAPK